MVQNLIILLLFLAAIAYLGYVIYQNFRMRSGCPSGCGSCGIDFDKIRRELAKKAVSK
ncbi:MAG: FeoB-associated Cys-rich membrane protein [Bacteroidota bacterium]|nr:FeoB-associated Cys-rich membrane protein [Bacteroidota bacterium]